MVADDPLARSGLTALLGEERGLAVVAQAGSSDGIGRLLEAYDPQVVVLDLGAGEPDRVPDLDGLGVPVLVLAPDDEHAREALAAGARGVLLRDAEGPRIAAALAAVAHGLVVLDDPLGEALRPRPLPPDPVEDLTPREREVLQLLSEGIPNRRIADRLGIGERTVKFHVNAILGKLGVATRTEAVVVAARRGLVTL